MLVSYIMWTTLIVMLIFHFFQKSFIMSSFPNPMPKTIKATHIHSYTQNIIISQKEMNHGYVIMILYTIYRFNKFISSWYVT